MYGKVKGKGQNGKRAERQNGDRPKRHLIYSLPCLLFSGCNEILEHAIQLLCLRD
jgi:hypothetical protein